VLDSLVSQGSKKVLKFQNNLTQKIIGKEEEIFGCFETQKIVAFFPILVTFGKISATKNIATLST
jgi:hypothetical protein